MQSGTEERCSDAAVGREGDLAAAKMKLQMLVVTTCGQVCALVESVQMCRELITGFTQCVKYREVLGLDPLIST